MTDDPIILPTPVAVIQHPESRFSVLARFFSWVTATTLAISVLVALVSITGERDNLRQQLACRASAGVAVNSAIINEQIALAEHNVLVGEFITLVIRKEPDTAISQAKFEDLSERIQTTDASLADIGKELQTAIAEQKDSLRAC